MPFASKIAPLYNPTDLPFQAVASNETFGSSMNINVTFSGTPELIHDGGDTVAWAASAISGPWDFASATNPDAGAACIEMVGGSDGDSALFEDPTSTDMSTRTAVTGRIRLEKWGNGTKGILLQFRLNGVNVGTSADLNQVLDINLLSEYQSFAVPKASFGITTETVDELLMTVYAINGTVPDFRFDTLQIQESGDPVTFRITPLPGGTLYIHYLLLKFVDNVPSTLLNNSLPALTYNKLLSVDRLPNGIVTTATQNGATLPGSIFRDLNDLLLLGCDPLFNVSDGVNTMITFKCPLLAPIVLQSKTNDSLNLTISDDLSSFVEFKGGALCTFRPGTS